MAHGRDGEAGDPDGRHRREGRDERLLEGPDATQALDHPPRVRRLQERPGVRDDRGEQRNGRHASQDQGFVDRDMDSVTSGVIAFVVPAGVIRDDPFDEKRHRDRQRQNHQQPVLRGAGRSQRDAGAVETQQHERDVSVAGQRAHQCGHELSMDAARPVRLE